MSISTTELTDYLDAYAASLSGFDAEAAAALWSLPGMIVDERFSGVLETRETMVAGLERSYPIYAQLGLASVGYELLDHTAMAEGLVMVQVRWDFFDAEAALLTDSVAHYLLRREEDGLRATVCVQTDDLEKLEALAAEKGVDLTPPED